MVVCNLSKARGLGRRERAVQSDAGHDHSGHGLGESVQGCADLRITGRLDSVRQRACKLVGSPGHNVAAALDGAALSRGLKSSPDEGEQDRVAGQVAE
jgi:hypothetical protein